jgi:hypothetical protein
MRRSIDWVVVCLSLLCLGAYLSSGPEPAPPELQPATPLAVTRLEFARALAADPGEPQFGYIRADGSFLPLAGDSPVAISASPSWQ